MNIRQNINMYKILMKKHSPEILSTLGCIGVITTAVMSAKATPKAVQLKKEKEEYKIKEYGEPLTKFEVGIAIAPAYIPTICMGLMTIGCIVGASHINKKRQANLIAAYGYLHSCYNDYKKKTNELFGEDTDSKVMTAIAKDHLSENTLNKEHGNEEVLCFDPFSNRYFYFDPLKIKDVVYEVNKLYNLMGIMRLNDIYDYLDLEQTQTGEMLGWCRIKDCECAGFTWIDIKLEETMELSDNLETKVLTFNLEPSDDYLEWCY